MKSGSRFTALVSTLAAVTVIGSSSAFAETQEIPTNDDQHLHLIQNSSQVSQSGAFVNRWGGGASSFQGTVYDVYITKGPIRITEDRFLHLIDKSKTSPDLINAIKGDHQAAFVEGLTAWSGLIVGSLSAIIGAGMLTSGPGGVPDPSGSGFVIAGVLMYVGGVVAACMWLGHQAPKGAPNFQNFTPEEALDAIKAYNKAIDKKEQAQ